MAHIKIKDLLELAPRKPAKHSVLLRGDHGIGKSQVVRQIGAALDNMYGKHFPIVDIRISQMSDGDMIGLPYTVDGVTGKKDERQTTASSQLSTRFAPPEWYMMCCRQPCVLFLDEFNRGTPEIMQACFQIVLDREMNLVKLHPETRVFAAINMSTQYNVNQMDPALLDRLSTYDLAPDSEEWIAWARTAGIHSNIISFISEQDYWLDPPKKAEVKQGATGSASYDPTEVHPSRRSWEMLNFALTEMGVIEDWKNNLFYHECLGRIGAPATIAWQTFLKLQSERAITGAMIIDDYLTPENETGSKKKRKKKGDSIEDVDPNAAPVKGAIQERVEQIKDFDKLNVIIESVTAEINKRNLDKPSEKQCLNIAAWLKFLPHELRFVQYTNLSKNPDRTKFIIATHHYITNIVMEIFGIDPNLPADKQTQIKTPEFIARIEAEQKKKEEAAAAAAAQ